MWTVLSTSRRSPVKVIKYMLNCHESGFPLLSKVHSSRVFITFSASLFYLLFSKIKGSYEYLHSVSIGMLLTNISMIISQMLYQL